MSKYDSSSLYDFITGECTSCGELLSEIEWSWEGYCEACAKCTACGGSATVHDDNYCGRKLNNETF